MEFFIRKNSTDPVLKMQLIQDGRSDFQSFHTKLTNATLAFSMKNSDTGAFKILNQPAGVVKKVNIESTSPDEYYVYYRWRKQDVNKTGRYEGQFSVRFLDDCNELIFPIREDLYININDSFVRTGCDCC
tara:strand:+ start:22393 stop:22782 length:390 start_codon:yes stop_codon:yes gene_type:complete